MTEWVLVPREPTAKMVLAAFDAITNASGEGMIRARWRCMLDAAPAAPQQAEPVAWMAFGGALVHAVTRNAMDPIEAERFDVPLYLHPPAAPQQAEPVEQIGWADEFGNLFPMAAWKPAQRTHHDAHKTAWRPVFLHPPAAEVQAGACPHCGSDCNERDELTKAEREIARLRAEVEALRADAERYRWLKGHSAYTTVTPCIHGEANGPSRMRWYHDSHQLHAFTLDAAIDAAMAQGDKA